jgi:AraC-like DNA-binding protein
VQSEVFEDLELHSSDLAETEDFLVRAYTPMRIGGDREQPRTDITRRWLGEVSIDQLAFTYDMSYDANALERICLCRVQSGHIHQHNAGQAADIYAPGDIVSFAPPEASYSGQVREASYDLVMFDPALLLRVAGGGRGETAVKLTGHRPISAAAGAQLDGLITYLADHVLNNPTARGSELLVGNAVSLLAATVLNTLPNNAALEASADRNDATPHLLRRAIAYIEGNAHTDLTLRDIADHTCVSPRAIQLMFRRHLDCTPTQYLRSVRLHLAHRDLMASDPATVTVAYVAQRWGFAHMGRFAAHYRERYGHSPHTTLRS